LFSPFIALASSSGNNDGGTYYKKGALPFVLKIVISLWRTISLGSMKK